MNQHNDKRPLKNPCSQDTPQHGICGFSGKFCIHCERWCMCQEFEAVEKEFYEMGVIAGYAKAIADATYRLEEHVSTRGWDVLGKMGDGAQMPKSLQDSP